MAFGNGLDAAGHHRKREADCFGPPALLQRRVDGLAGVDQALTEATDFAIIACSSLLRRTFTTRSTPLAPITTGTPMNMSRTPYSPLR